MKRSSCRALCALLVLWCGWAPHATLAFRALAPRPSTTVPHRAHGARAGRDARDVERALPVCTCYRAGFLGPSWPTRTARGHRLFATQATDDGTMQEMKEALDLASAIALEAGNIVRAKLGADVIKTKVIGPGRGTVFCLVMYVSTFRLRVLLCKQTLAIC